MVVVLVNTNPVFFQSVTTKAKLPLVTAVYGRLVYVIDNVIVYGVVTLFNVPHCNTNLLT